MIHFSHHFSRLAILVSNIAWNKNGFCPSHLLYSEFEIFKISLFINQNNDFAIPLMCKTQSFIAEVFTDFFSIFVFKSLQSWTKLVEANVEVPVKSRNGLIFQNKNPPNPLHLCPCINVESGQVFLPSA